jgi:hypothetical protein
VISKMYIRKSMFFGSTYKLSIKLVKIGRKKTGNCELKALIIQQQKPWLPLPSLVEHFSLSTSSNRDLLKRICYFSSSFFFLSFFLFFILHHKTKVICMLSRPATYELWPEKAYIHHLDILNQLFTHMMMTTYIHSYMCSSHFA